MRLPYGYTVDENGNIALNEYEVGVVHLIYDSYLSGLSLIKLSGMLAEKNIYSPTLKERWSVATLDKMLSNKKYYPVVGMEKYVAVQFEKDRRSSVDEGTGKRKAVKYDSRNVLSGLFVCGECNKNYRRVQRASGEMVWRCANRVEYGNRVCKSSPTITEEEAIKFVCETLNISELESQTIRESLYSITVEKDGTLMPDLQQSEFDELMMG